MAMIVRGELMYVLAWITKFKFKGVRDGKRQLNRKLGGVL
jgi:hypothetical protein